MISDTLRSAGWPGSSPHRAGKPAAVLFSVSNTQGAWLPGLSRAPGKTG